MDTGKLKRFAAEARVNLMDGVRLKLRMLGFDENGNCSIEPQLIQGGTLFRGEEYPEAFYRQWKALKERISVHGVREVVEEAAYTWFNRMMAIRILTKNELCEPILMTDGSASGYPLLLEAARMSRVPEMDAQERRRFDKLMEDDTLTSEQFSMLLTVWCHDNPIIKSCFGSINGYAELLLPSNIIRPDGFIALLNNTGFIADEDFKSAELIGWLYQFYISERKDEVMKKQKYAADEIPAATQIFTPNWIVKYMVENTILPQVEAADEIIENAKYLVKNPDATPCKKVELEDLKVADFACGSGHILNECFDLLFALYRDEAYSRKEAIEAIFTKNLLGIDIDLRAKQLAMFALLLKACQKDDSFADAHCLPRVLTVPDMPELVQNARGYLPHFFLGGPTKDAMEELVESWEDIKHADVLGSIIKFNISSSTRRQIYEAVQHWRNDPFISHGIQVGLPIMDFILSLTDSYDAIVMNPPYMATNKDDVLKKYAVENYPDSKADLFTVFMDVAIERLKIGGRYGMINMQSWMFLSSFESLRKKIIKEQQIESLLHLGPRTFDELSGEVVQNAAFVICNDFPSSYGIYFRLIFGKDCEDKRDIFLNQENKFLANQNLFDRIAGSPIGYWASETMLYLLSEKKFFDFGKAVKGPDTGDDKRFLRFWWEPSAVLNYWKPYQKGGSFRKWYGNKTMVINWKYSGVDIEKLPGSRVQNKSYFFKPGFEWSRIASGSFGVRLMEDSLFGGASTAGFPMRIEDLNFYIGLYNTPIVYEMLQIINPTLVYQAGDINRIPIKKETIEFDNIIETVNACISISKEDWDAHETSWDFKENELLRLFKEHGPTLKMLGQPLNLWSTYQLEYVTYWSKKFGRLRKNEIELNRKFIEIYGLQEELSPDVPLEEVTILQQGEIDLSKTTPMVMVSQENGEEKRESGYGLHFNEDVIIKQLISYIVGCYMGRYRLDKPGLAIAHPNPKEEDLADYTFNIVGEETFKIDPDAIIPVLPQGAPFYDNLINYVSDFIRKVWGKDSHTENMNFIDRSLGKPLNDYLMKDFWKYHKKMYQNRPIYWEFASPKGAFRALVYAHRMDKFTVEVLRSKYLLPYINFIEQKIHNLDARANDLSTAERRELDNLRKKTLPELREYHDRVQQVAAETAARETVFDLDDGIPHNHALFGSIVTKLK